MLVAWRPLEYGEFANKKAQKLLDPLAKKYNKTHFQIALNWILHHENIVTLFMSRTPENIVENI